MTSPTVVRGYKAIAAFLGEIWGFTVTAQSAWRWSNAEVDPLPVHRIAVANPARPMVASEAEQLRKWAERRMARATLQE